MKALVYNNGWTRNAKRIALEAMPAFAASFVGKSVLEQHDPTRKLGKITSSVWDATAQALEQEFAFTDYGNERMAAGGDPEFSVGWDRLPDTKIMCSICNIDILGPDAYDCAHYWQRGKTLSDGRVVEWVFSSAEGLETSVVVGPAFLGTKVLNTADGVDELVQQRRDQNVKETEELKAQLAAANAELETERQNRARVEGERLNLESEGKCKACAEQGVLTRGTMDMWVKCRAKNPEVFDEAMSFVAPNAALAPKRVLVPETPTEPVKSEAERLESMTREQLAAHILQRAKAENKTEIEIAREIRRALQ